MQPYISPNYFNQFQPPVFQQPVPQNNNTRLVNNFNEIQVNEIPMDGSYKLFAKSDMSEVQARAWNNNGTISIMEYSLKKPLEIEKANNVSTTDFKAEIQPILDEIKALNDKIDKITNVGGKKNGSTGNT